MNTRNQKLAGLLLMLVSFPSAMTQCSEGTALDDSLAPVEEYTSADLQHDVLTGEEVSGTLFMREEEKLARDVYLYLYELHPLRPFLNISRSEQAHMDAILYLIETYDLEDPVGTNPEGVFQNQELQQMYDELVVTGATSREEALKVGALIEEVDIIDLRKELDRVNGNEDLIRVYTNLCKASENHLRAFARVLSFHKEDYQPVLLEQEEFDRIMEE